MVNDLGRIRESNLKLRSSQIEKPLDSNNSTTQLIGQDDTYAACPSYIINIIYILLYTHRNSLVTSLEHAFTAGYPLICFRWFPSVSFGFLWFSLVWGWAGSIVFLRFSLVWGWLDSMVFLWFPLVSFGFLWFPLIFFGLGLGGFYGFPLVSLVFICFVWFSREKQRKRKPKEKTNQSRKK